MTQVFASIYELGNLFYFPGFSDDMYENDLYMTIGWFMIVSSLIWMIIYYIVIDHPKFARWYHWLLWVAALALINFGFAYYWTTTELEFIYEEMDQIVPHSSEFANYSIVNALWSMVLGLLLSPLLKLRATSTRRTPF